jgi:hypothetical protein
MHRARLKRHGDINKTTHSAHGSGAAFLRSLIGTLNQHCVTWPFAYFSDGYPRIRFEGKSRHATRIMCLLAHGEPPEGKPEAAHNCGNARCVNPSHLEWKSSAGNAADKILHGTTGAGENNPRAKLTAPAAAKIRELFASGTGIRVLADLYQVSPQNIRHIVTGKTWRHP